MNRKIELLVPASSLEVLKIAIDYGADAVYIGGEVFSLRAKAKNFTISDMIEGIEYAHQRNKKVYVTANILAHNDDLDEAKAYFEELKKVKPDAVIISDPGIFALAKKLCLKWKSIYQLRQIIQIMQLINFGGIWVQQGL